MKIPCQECPFSRSVEPGALGGSSPEIYIGQVLLPFWLPCHRSANYQGKASDVNEVQECHGAAIMRANLGVKTPDALLTLPPNRQLVFASLAEFYAHHARLSLYHAERLLTKDIVKRIVLRELSDSNVKVQLKERKIR